MTLKLVSDNTVELPITSLLDISGMARGFADEVDEGKHGSVDRVVLIVEYDDGIKLLGWGARDCSPYELMGLFEAAKLRVFAEDFVDDEE